MALRTKTVVIDAAGGRDAGKTFVVTEMAARPAHRWATRAIFALMNTGLELPDDFATAGFAGLATLGIKALGQVDHAAMEPLMDELLTCVQFIPDPSRPAVALSDLERHVEEFKTFFVLQKEALMIHVQPFTNGVQSSGALTPGNPPHAS